MIWIYSNKLRYEDKEKSEELKKGEIETEIKMKYEGIIKRYEKKQKDVLSKNARKEIEEKG